MGTRRVFGAGELGHLRGQPNRIARRRGSVYCVPGDGTMYGVLDCVPNVDCWDLGGEMYPRHRQTLDKGGGEWWRREDVDCGAPVPPRSVPTIPARARVGQGEAAVRWLARRLRSACLSGSPVPHHGYGEKQGPLPIRTREMSLVPFHVGEAAEGVPDPRPPRLDLSVGWIPPRRPRMSRQHAGRGEGCVLLCRSGWTNPP